MFSHLIRKLLGSANDRRIKNIQPLITAINARESDLEKLTSEDLRAQTEIFRARLKKGETLDSLLVDAFATVREAAKRTLGLRPFDVQLMGGIVLHQGAISEMMTGEGKTLVATLPAYLNALTGQGVHIITVNDYLAHRDAHWMGQIYQFLGLTVGCILTTLDDSERRQAYEADITYGTNNEFGFDYLRDNMKFRPEEMVQRAFNFAIVDEVDSILIDEARTPLIISGPAEDSSELYQKVNTLIPHLSATDYEKDEKARAVTLTEAGSQRIEELLEKNNLITKGSLYEIHNIGLVHHVNQALRAHTLFTRDVDYIVKDQKLIIIDEFTGRMMEGRRYSDGLHQALEAKENVPIQVENQTLASITFQNYFRLYPKLAGMTGTAMTEASEFADIYNLDVARIPTNLPLMRKDHHDEVYRTSREKYEAILALIVELQKKGQPVLVGTTSIEKSDYISNLLRQKNIPHHVLNARYHEQEAFIIAQAGKVGAVTVATNMAGRGTDIKLGGNAEMLFAQESEGITDEAALKALSQKIKDDVQQAQEQVKKMGGLYIIGTERHESRRIDNQLRGRAGRQGDPGASKFFLSLEDDLMRLFGSERLDSMLQKLGLEEGEAIIHPWVNKALERAQQKVEARNYEIRKNLLKFDDVMNDQRKIIYSQRRDLMTGEDTQEIVEEMRTEVIESLITRFIPENAYPDQWDASSLHEECMRLLNLNLPIKEWSEEEGIADIEIKQRLMGAVQKQLDQKEKAYGKDLIRAAEKSILLRILDQSWKDHLLSLDHLRQGINLRAYAQRDPLNEYKQEAFMMFSEMLERVREITVSSLSYLELREETEEEIQEAVFEDAHSARKNLTLEKPELFSEIEDTLPPVKATLSISRRLSNFGSRASKKQGNQVHKKGGLSEDVPSENRPISRNAPCHCGSGKRYKHCHGSVE